MPVESCIQRRLVMGSDRNSHRSFVEGHIERDLLYSNIGCWISTFYKSFEHHDRNICQVYHEIRSLRSCTNREGELWERVGQWARHLNRTLGVVILPTVALRAHVSAIYRFVIIVYGQCKGRGPFLKYWFTIVWSGRHNTCILYEHHVS